MPSRVCYYCISLYWHKRSDWRNLPASDGDAAGLTQHFASSFSAQVKFGLWGNPAVWLRLNTVEGAHEIPFNSF